MTINFKTSVYTRDLAESVIHDLKILLSSNYKEYIRDNYLPRFFKNQFSLYSSSYSFFIRLWADDMHIVRVKNPIDNYSYQYFADISISEETLGILLLEASK